MIKFDIKNRWSGAVQFTAEINCSEDAPTSIKVGLAVKWAVEARADLADANWQAFDDRRIASMDGTRSSRFWRDHKDGLLSLAGGAGRSFDPVIAAEAAE